MKQLTCEMCGSTDLIKDGGVFVCQTCGCKYSIEEAKRMMIEGTVDVQGTVKVDNSAFVAKYLANARRAKEKEDWEETEKYYNMVEQNDPDNIEAIFYSAYGKAKSTLVDGDLYKRQAAFKVLSNCISVIDDHYKPERREENKEAITQMAADLSKMLLSSFVFTEWKNGYGSVVRTNKNETYSLFTNLIVQFRESINNIQKIDDQPYLHEALITLYSVAKGCSYVKASTMEEWIREEQGELDSLRKAVLEAYWSEHAEEKAALDSEKSSLESQTTELNDQIQALPEVITVKEIKSQIESKTKEKDSLGLFKGKEKKALQAEIDALEKRLTAAQEAQAEAAKPLNESIEKLRERIAEIDHELTKDR